MTYIDNIFRSISQALNCVLFFGDSQESISSRCYRENWTLGIKIINKVFFWQNHHCRGAYAKDLEWAKAFINKVVKQ